jgi:uncharacterized surface protein with fasciclin (FAS1) repeats
MSSSKFNLFTNRLFILIPLIAAMSLVSFDAKASDSVAPDFIKKIVNAAQGKQDIVDTAIRAGSFTKLVAALNAADLVNALKGPGPFTVFAPTDAAFAKLPASLQRDLLKPENKDTLVAILTYHVLPRTAWSGTVVNLDVAETLNGQLVNFKTGSSGVMVNDANIIGLDISATNGVIHVIDTVLVPNLGSGPDVVDLIADSGRFPTLVAALQAAGLDTVLKGQGPFTVFAPTEKAFSKIPPRVLDDLLKPQNLNVLTDILTFHVAPRTLLGQDVVKLNSIDTVNGKQAMINLVGGNVYIENAKIINTDFIGSNGVVHIIDTVIIP